ncbi:hypothetical protein MHYP_G00160450 [Metynnis hypsauchen]
MPHSNFSCSSPAGAQSKGKTLQRSLSFIRVKTQEAVPTWEVRRCSWRSAQQRVSQEGAGEQPSAVALERESYTDTHCLAHPQSKSTGVQLKTIPELWCETSRILVHSKLEEFHRISSRSRTEHARWTF